MVPESLDGTTIVIIDPFTTITTVRSNHITSIVTMSPVSTVTTITAFIDIISNTTLTQVNNSTVDDMIENILDSGSTGNVTTIDDEENEYMNNTNGHMNGTMSDDDYGEVENNMTNAGVTTSLHPLAFHWWEQNSTGKFICPILLVIDFGQN